MDVLARRGAALFGAVVTASLFASSCTAAPIEPTRPTSCAADYSESNDTPETARELPPLKDEKSSRADIVDLTVHTTRDEDWFRIPIKDTGWQGNPVVTATVSSTSFEVSTWFICDEGSESLECKVGAETRDELGARIGYADGCDGVDSEAFAEDGTVQDAVHFAVSSTDCSGTSDDNGTLYVRVRHTGFFGSASESEALKWTCGYDLSVSVE